MSGVHIDIDMDISEIESLDLVPARSRRRALKAAAGHYLLLQRKRIARGESVDGGSFRPYNDQYRSRKSRAGRTGEGEWLRLTGKMLRSQRVRMESSDSAVISFEGTRPTGRIVKRGKKPGGPMVVRLSGGEMVSNSMLAGVNDRLRPFIGMNETEKKEISNVFFDNLVIA